MAFGTATVKTNVGLGIVAKRLIGATPAQAETKYQAIGTGATGAARTAAATDTALSTEVETRQTAGGVSSTTTVTNDTTSWTITTTATAVRSVDEAGLFDQSAVGGNMLISATFAVVTLQIGDGLQNTWKWQST